MRTILVSLCVVGAVFATTTARAQHLEPAIPRVSELGSFWPNGQVMGQMDLYSENDFTLLGFHVNAWGRLTPGFALEGTMGFVHVDADGTATTGTNPTFSGYYVHESRNTLLRVGAGVSVPLVEDEDRNVGHAYWFTRGLRDAWQFVPHHVGFIPSFRIDGKSRDSFAWGADAELGILLPTEDGYDTDVQLQAGGDFTVIVHPVFQVGGRAQFGWLATGAEPRRIGDPDIDNFQLSLVPFMRFVFGAGFVEGRFVINIDEPGGFSFDDGKIWLFQIRGGGRF